MKDLTDRELLDLANEQFKIMDNNLFSQITLCLLIVIQATLLILEMISIYFYVPIWLVCMVLYFFHRKKVKSAEIKVQEIIDEFTSR